MEKSKKLSFSGHETFYCRHYWLKKGYDFINNKHRFTEPEAVVHLGVGKNMVTSIAFWMKAFGVLDENNKLTRLADFLFKATGRDPYLEDTGSFWLLHYFLVKTGRASIYSLFFNEFRKERIEFNRLHLESFIQRKCLENGQKISDNTIKKDVAVFLRNYLRPRGKKIVIEDDFSAILIDLDLIQELSVVDGSVHNWYVVKNMQREEIPKEIILFAILDSNHGENSISFQKLLNDYNSVGNIFALSANGLLTKIEEITACYPEIVFTDDAGIKELQLRKRFNKWKILENYYEDEVFAIRQHRA